VRCSRLLAAARYGLLVVAACVQLFVLIVFELIPTFFPA
jgi:hypothetical protein